MTKARDLANAGTALTSVSATELAFLDGVTSAVQTQIDAKAASSTAATLTGTQTLTNKTLTNPVIASVINNTLTSTTGDIIYASGANTPARLGIGSSAQVLTVASGVPSWATPAVAASGLTLISATTCSAVTTQAVTGFSATYQNYRIIMAGEGTSDGYVYMKMRSSSTDSSTAYYFYANRWFSSNANQQAPVANGADGFEVSQSFAASSMVVDVCRPFESVRTTMFSTGIAFNTSSTRSVSAFNAGVHNAATSYDGFNLILTGGTFTGTIYLYGYQKS